MPSRFWIISINKEQTWTKWEKSMLEHIADFTAYNPYGNFHWLYCQPHHERRRQRMLYEPIHRYCGQLCRRHHQQSAEHRTVWQGLSYQLHFLRHWRHSGIVDLEETLRLVFFYWFKNIRLWQTRNWYSPNWWGRWLNMMVAMRHASSIS